MSPGFAFFALNLYISLLFVKYNLTPFYQSTLSSILLTETLSGTVLTHPHICAVTSITANLNAIHLLGLSISSAVFFNYYLTINVSFTLWTS